jgi:threonine/homoserine/homoserine lactone efflux protein
VGVTNPKLAVFLAAVLPQFVDTDRSTTLQIAVLGAIFAVVALVCDGAWGVAAGSARHWLGRSPRRLQRLTTAGGLVMIAVGVAVALH